MEIHSRRRLCSSLSLHTSPRGILSNGKSMEYHKFTACRLGCKVGFCIWRHHSCGSENKTAVVVYPIVQISQKCISGEKGYSVVSHEFMFVFPVQSSWTEQRLWKIPKLYFAWEPCNISSIQYLFSEELHKSSINTLIRNYHNRASW